MKKVLLTIVIGILLIVIAFAAYKVINYTNTNPNVKEKNRDNKPKENEPYKEKTTLTDQYSDNSEKIELKYDQYVVANGFTGATDHVYYTRNNVLYHLKVSTNESIVLAEGVKKIEEDIDTVLVYKNSDFKVLNKDNYVTYVD